HDARIDVAEDLEIEQRRGVVGVLEDIGRRLVDRRRARAGRGIELRAGVDAQGVEAEVAHDVQLLSGRLRLPPLPKSKGLRLSMTLRATPIQPISPDRRPYSILGQRSITTFKPAPRAISAASSLTTPSCIQIVLRPRRSFSASASLTIPGAASEPRK